MPYFMPVIGADLLNAANGNNGGWGDTTNYISHSKEFGIIFQIHFKKYYPQMKV